MTGITSWRDFGAALFVLAGAIVFLLWTQTIPPRATAMPMLVAWLTIVLALIDVVSQTNTALGRYMRRFVSADRIIEWKVQGDGAEAGWGRILLSILWVAGYLAGIYFIGFLLATPSYVLLYMILHGGKSIRASATAAAATTLLIWLTFEVAFKYPLYPGALFGGY
jgi:hypothetical protein